MSSLVEKKGDTEIQKSQASHFMSPFEEIERIFESFSNRGWLRPFHWESVLPNDVSESMERKMPSVDVIDNDDKIIVKAELPGVEKKDIDVSVTGNTVTIKGSSRHEEKKEEDNYYRCEISKGNYMRTITLPAKVDEEKVKAKLKDGMLELVMPKVEKSHRKSIKVD